MYLPISNLSVCLSIYFVMRQGRRQLLVSLLNVLLLGQLGCTTRREPGQGQGQIPRPIRIRLMCTDAVQVVGSGRVPALRMIARRMKMPSKLSFWMFSFQSPLLRFSLT